MHATTITLTLSSPPLLSAFYEPLWMPAHVAGEDFAHIEVRSIYPTAVPLPIANTGLYRNTLPARVITAAGGPVAFIDVMMAAREVHHGDRTLENQSNRANGLNLVVAAIILWNTVYI